ncbi:MAG: substrate-binding domain-containing protein [Pseudomonadota bacterium]
MTPPAQPGLLVLCAGAVKSAATAAAEGFGQAGDAAPAFDFGTAGGLGKRVAAGEAADVLIASRGVLDALAATGAVLPDTVTHLGSVGVGIAVRVDAPAPDISSPPLLRQALLTARSIACSDASTGDSSGQHFAWVLEQLGITDAVADRRVLARLGLEVAEQVARGAAELGATQASVILGCPGVRLAGLLPAELQHTTVYAAGIPRQNAAPEAARAFLAHLGTPAGRAVFRAAGFAAPE